MRRLMLGTVLDLRLECHTDVFIQNMSHFAHLQELVRFIFNRSIAVRRNDAYETKRLRRACLAPKLVRITRCGIPDVTHPKMVRLETELDFAFPSKHYDDVFVLVVLERRPSTRGNFKVTHVENWTLSSLSDEFDA